jgi:N-acetylated-alpha-linked acidic dipeptidase
LSGNGPSGEEINRTNWIGAADVEYSSGPAPGVTVSMSNLMKENITTIWNTIGIINGTNQDEVVIVGNHRDAWMIGGAADPNSGSACFVEMTKAFNALLATGWQPKRTIVLASWDAEEYGIVGSTEWVEEYVPWIRQSNVAYINLDTAVSGPVPDISATPDLHAIGLEVMKKIVYPYQNLTNVTMYDVYTETSESGIPGVLGSGSDYTAFLHGNGISSIDIGSNPGPDSPVYHYHSNYDTYHWMSAYGDPGYVTHKAIAQYTTLLVYYFANEEILPLDPGNYGVEMTKYLEELQFTIEDAAAEDSAASEIDLSALVSAIESFNASAAAFAELASSADLSDDNVALLNTKLKDYQRGFASNGGMPRREFFKHVVFTPGLDTGYAPVTWPGVTEAVVAGNWTEAQSEVARAAGAVEVAAGILRP